MRQKCINVLRRKRALSPIYIRANVQIILIFFIVIAIFDKIRIHQASAGQALPKPVEAVRTRTSITSLLSAQLTKFVSPRRRPGAITSLLSARLPLVGALPKPAVAVRTRTSITSLLSAQLTKFVSLILGTIFKQMLPSCII